VSTRITQSMLSRTLLTDLQDVSSRLAATQAKLSSGKEITKPSDDPFGTSRALQFRSDIAQSDQYLRNVQEAGAWQNVTDTALGQMGDIALRARDLLVQGASDAVGQPGRDAIATEIDQLVEGLKSAGNTQYAGRYVFSGQATTTPPYQAGANDQYLQGNAALQANPNVVREIGPGVHVAINVTGQSVIGDDTTGLLATLRQISADLRSGNAAALQSGDLAALDAGHQAVTTARANVGALTNRLDSAQNRIQDLEDSSKKLLSDTEDADMAKTLIDFSTQQAVYQSALKSGAQIIQPSLMDFLH
jgi:flagellar hook-associated protein 3 FlgL